MMQEKMKSGKRIMKVLIAMAVLLCLGIVFLLYTFGKVGMGPLKTIALNRPPVQLADEMFRYSGQDFSVAVGSQTVRGTLYVPDHTSSHENVVIISHGFATTGSVLAAKAKSFAQAGVPALVYDFRGGSNNSSSDGSTVDMTLSTEKADLNAVIGKIRQMPGFEHTNVYLMGESFGGLVTALTGAERADIAGLILCFPAFHTAASARDSFPTPADIPETVDAIGMTTGRNFWSELWNLDIYEEIAKYDGEVLLLYGTADPAVPQEYILQANEAYRNSALMLIEGAGHGFSGDDEKSTLKTAYQFIIKTRRR